MPAYVSRTALPLAALLVLGHAAPAEAQSFLKNLAREAAYRAATAAATSGANGGQPAQAQAAVASEDAGGSGGAVADQPQPAAVTTGPAPWPQNLGERSVKSPAQLTFSPELEAQKKAFLEFSKVRCNDCEGGYSYDAWGQHFVRLDGSWKAWEKKLGALGVGESLTWQGSQSKAAITVVSETPVGAWPCKQLRWTLTRPNAKAERPGLICNARPDGNPDWTLAF